MADTGEKKYSNVEAVNRILRALIGAIAPDDAPGTLAGSILSIDGMLSKLAEVLEGNDPDNTFTLPNANYGSINADGDIISSGDITASGTFTIEDGVIRDDLDVGGDADVTGILYADAVLGDEGVFGDIAGGDYTTFDTEGTMLMYGNATVWDDLRFPALALRVPPAGASAEPDLVQFRDNNDGSTGVFSYAFDAGTEEEMYFAVQMPHSWAGTPISPHVHWAVMVGTTGTVGWGMEYTWAELSGTFGYTAFIAGNQNYLGEDNLVAYRHYLTGLPDITGTFGSGTISSMLVGRIFRDAGASLVADSCPQDVVLLELDFHFEIDRLGSNQEYVR